MKNQINKLTKRNPRESACNPRLSASFTLVEMLVVIVIIGLLSTLALVALGTARARARDTKRVADIKQVQTALEIYFAEKAEYPKTAGIEFIELGSTSYKVLCVGNTANGFVAASSSCGGIEVKVYMLNVPFGPTPNDGACTEPQNKFMYKSTNGADYELTFCLGGEVGGLDKGSRTATPAGIK